MPDLGFRDGISVQKWMVDCRSRSTKKVNAEAKSKRQNPEHRTAPFPAF